MERFLLYDGILIFIGCVALFINYVLVYAKCIQKSKDFSLSPTIAFCLSLPGIMFILVNLFGFTLEGIIGKEGFWSQVMDSAVDTLFNLVFPNMSMYSDGYNWFILIICYVIPFIMAFFTAICSALIISFYKTLESQEKESAWLQALFYYFLLENAKNICKQ